MESWVVGYDGDGDVERHAGVRAQDKPAPPLKLRIVSDYI
jgi:hypothetical protein